MDRLSVGIDVNYVGAIEKEQMDAERPSLEDRIERLMARRATLHGASRPSTLAANGSTAMPPRWAGRNHRDRHQLSLPQPKRGIVEVHFGEAICQMSLLKSRRYLS